MDTIDQLLKQYLARKVEAKEDRSIFIPNEALWHRFFENSLTPQESDEMAAFLSKDPEAREFAFKTRRMLLEADTAISEAPRAWVVDAKKKVGSKAALPKKRHFYLIWYAIALLSFGLSFAIPRYYMQLLVVTALFGIKAIADQRQAKMQILIYQALESGKEINSDRLKELGIKK